MCAEVPETGVCLGCGYSLRGLPESVCPECGRAFLPEDPSTFQDGPVPSSWRRYAAAPSTWELLGVAAVLVGYLHCFSLPEGVQAETVLAFVILCPLANVVGGPLGVFLVVTYVGRVNACRADRGRARLDRAYQPKRGSWRWAVLPLCLAMAASAWLNPWPLRVRFALSQPAFDAAVGQILAGTPVKTMTGRVGLYWIDHIRDHSMYSGGTIVFQTIRVFHDFSYGFLYEPPGARASRSRGIDLGSGWRTYSSE